MLQIRAALFITNWGKCCYKLGQVSQIRNNSKLLLTVTDSLMYEIKPTEVYKDFSKDKEMFDFSNH